MVTKAFLLGILSAAVVTDLLWKKIPNLLILAGLCGGFGRAGYLAWQTRTLSLLPEAAAGAIVPVLLLFLLFRFRMMGAGDIKLFAVIGSWIGPASVIQVMVCSFIAGGILSLLIMLIRRNLRARLSYLKSYFTAYLNTGVILPYRQADHRDAEFSFALVVLAGYLMYLGGLRL